MDECKPLVVGGVGARGGGAGGQGRAVHVDPMKPKVKAPGTKHLKLLNHEPPSNFAFKFNLHHYTEGQGLRAAALVLLHWAGRCRLKTRVQNPSSKRAWLQRLKLKLA